MIQNQSDAVAPMNLSIEISFGGSAKLIVPTNVNTAIIQPLTAYRHFYSSDLPYFHRL